MKTIIQKDLYERGKEYFAKSELEFLIYDLSQEDKMIAAQKKTNAKCFIIGAEEYSREFYNSLNPDSLVIRFGVGYDKVPLDICRERGIKVAYTPHTLDESVAEHTIGLILASARNIIKANTKVINGQWEISSGLELKGKTLAIIGFGKIGQQTARIAKDGFKMKINALDIFEELKSNLTNIVDYYSTDFNSVVKEADFVSLHLCGNQETFNYIDQNKLEMMKKEAILVNTGRGQLINEVDLYQALKEGIISGAALDVYHNEPYSPLEGKDLRELDNIILTPHISSNTDVANRRMTELCISNAFNYYKNNLEKVIFIPKIS